MMVMMVKAGKKSCGERERNKPTHKKLPCLKNLKDS